MTRRDVIGCVCVVLALAAATLFRSAVVDPRDWGAACAARGAPLACLPREALLWLQYRGLLGALALAAGLWAFLGAPFAAAVAAVAAGAVATANYNATFGVLGASLGAWAWLMRVPRPARPPAA